MARTTADEVKLIMDGCTLDDSVVDAYITAASEVVTNALGTDTNIGTVLKDEIEKWLTAHMIASTRFRTASKEKVGDASIEYAGKFGLGLDSTPYGQMVKTLDTTGKMGQIGMKAATIRSVEQFDD